MIVRRQFEPADVSLITPQDSQAAELEYALNLPETLFILAMQPSFTIADGEEILCVGGIVFMEERRGTCWSMLSQNLARNMVRVTREVQAFIAEQDFRRLELAVSVEDTDAHRWAKLLGFEMETESMFRYFRNGTAASMYVRFI